MIEWFFIGGIVGGFSAYGLAFSSVEKLKRQNNLLLAQTKKHKEDCAKGGKAVSAKRAAFVAITTKRLQDQVAAGQLQPICPRDHVVSGVVAERAIFRRGRGLSDARYSA